LKSKFDVAFGVLCDVVKAPRFEQKDFTRVKKLYKNALKKRLSDPESVAAAVTMRELYGEKSPYGHPVSGYLSKADALDVSGVKAAWEKTFRPDRLTLIVVGQITRPEVEKALAANLGEWKPKGEALPAPKLGPVASERARIVLVDRPKAVQTVVVVARDGVAASDARASGLQLVNAALGGSFTSRLNTNLREEKNWTYGIGSTFTMSRGQGAFYVRTSVETQYTGRAVKEILGELTKISDQGLTDAELGKVKALDRADLVETYETGSGTASRLAALVAAGLPPGFDAAATRLRQNSSKVELARLAKEQLGPQGMTIVLVGDRAEVEKQLADEGLGAPELAGPEGQRLGKPKDPAPKLEEPAPKPKKK
jgi:predicted Zn-dependent peptidase